MAVVVETTLGDITIDLFIEERPTTCMNFLKLCKIKYYNFCLFHSVQQNFIAQTGDPSGSGHGGSSIFHHTQGNSSNYYEAEKLPKIKHTNIGTVSMVNCGNQMLGSQLFITLGKDLQSLDGEHCVFGEVTEGHEILRKFNEVICDQGHRPYQDIRITHTVILEDPFDDPPGLKLPDSSPELTKEVLANSRIAPDEEIDETAGLTSAEVEEMQRKREAQAQATILEIVGDLPDADIAPPENVLFVCKLNPVTTDDDLEIIFSRFGKIVSCEVIRDKNTGDSLQYAFVEFDNRKACEDAYFKMDNVLIDDRRIHVDFSQSVSKLRWKGKGRLEHLDDAKSRPDYANYDRISDVKVRQSPDSSRQRGGENDSRANNRNSNRRENDRSSKVSRENNLWRYDGRHERSNERHSRIYSDSVRERYHRPRESHDSRERYRSEVNRESNYRNKHRYYERERYRNERRKDMYYREDKYQKKSKSESSDSEEKVSTNQDSQNKGICRKMQSEIYNEKLNYMEKEDVKEKYDDSEDKVKKVHRDKKCARKSSASSETEDESGSSTDQETERERSISKLRQREVSCEEIKTRDKKYKRQSSSEKNLAQHSVMKNEKRKRKDSGSDGEKCLTAGDRVDKRKVRPDDQENKGGKIKKEEKLSKMKSASNSSYEKVQKQDKYKHNRREVMVGSGSEVAKDAPRCQEKKRNRRNSSDSNESIHKSPSTRDTGKKDKKRERNNSTSTDHRSSSSKRKSDTRDDSESDEQTLAKKSNVVRNKYDSPRHSRRNIIKGKNKKKKQLKKREMVRKKKKRHGKRNKTSSSSRSSDSETVSSSSTSSSSSSSSSSSGSGSESSDSSSSPSSSTSSSSSDDNQRRKRRKKVSKANVVKKPKRGTIPKKTKKEHRKLTDVSEEDSRKVKGKVQKKKSESVGKNNIEKRVKVKSRSKRKRMTHSSDSSSESDSSEDSIRDSKRRKKIRK